MGKTRINITVDSELLEKSKVKLDLFGGKLSTLFNAYLNDFVHSMNSPPGESYKMLLQKIEDLEKRLGKIEKKTS